MSNSPVVNPAVVIGDASAAAAAKAVADAKAAADASSGGASCRLLTLPMLLGFYAVVSVVLGLFGLLLSGSTGFLVGLLLGVAGSVALYFTVGKGMINQPIPLIGNADQCPKTTQGFRVVNGMMYPMY